MGTFSFKVPGESQSQNSHLYPFDSLIFGSRFLHVGFSLGYISRDSWLCINDGLPLATFHQLLRFLHSKYLVASPMLLRHARWYLLTLFDCVGGYGMSIVWIRITPSLTVNVVKNLLASPKSWPVDSLSPHRV